MNPNLPKALTLSIKIWGFVCRLTSLKSKFSVNRKSKLKVECKRQPYFKSGTIFGEWSRNIVHTIRLYRSAWFLRKRIVLSWKCVLCYSSEKLSGTDDILSCTYEITKPYVRDDNRMCDIVSRTCELLNLGCIVANSTIVCWLRSLVCSLSFNFTVNHMHDTLNCHIYKYRVPTTPTHPLF